MAIRARVAPAARAQRGAVMVIVGLILVVMVGMGAFAIDVSRWLVVDNELQNGSDASALAGAGYLFPPVAKKPNWSEAEKRALTAISMNTSENVSLQTGEVVTGYWDFRNRVFDSDTAKTPTNDDLPAVRVTIDRKGSENAGPVSMLFGKLFGVQDIDARATATAVLSVPVSAGVGALAPIAISQCLLEGASPPLWDSARNAPVTPLVKFVISSGAGSGNHCNGCNCGQWTTFAEKISSAKEVRKELLTGGNPVQLAVGDNTWIQPGVRESVWMDAEILKGRDIVVPVVDDSSMIVQDGLFTPIRRWSCLRVFEVIDASDKGTCNNFNGEGPLPGGITDKGEVEKRCMVVSFSPDPCAVAGAEGGAGPFTGVYVPPRLVE
jgi:Flp pilus assembly protein TadG